jgi:hypothetical protein
MKSCCPYCATRDAKKESQSRSSGMYALDCLQCAAHLVLSARPSRLHQEAMFAAIARSRIAPKRDAIIAAIQEIAANDQANLFS